MIFPDLYGSIGGFLYGYLGGMMLLPIDSSSAGRFGRERIIQLTGLILVLALTLILILVFFLGNEPKVYRTFS